MALGATLRIGESFDNVEKCEMWVIVLSAFLTCAARQIVIFQTYDSMRHRLLLWQTANLTVR